MRLTLLRGASVGAVVIALVLAFLWLLRSPSSDLIPVEFRGIWLDQGAECSDTDAQVRITGSTIDGGGLSFKADGLAERGDDAVSLTGESFPDANTERTTVGLRMRDHRSQLVIVSGERRQGPFVRCSAARDA